MWFAIAETTTAVKTSLLVSDPISRRNDGLRNIPLLTVPRRSAREFIPALRQLNPVMSV